MDALVPVKIKPVIVTGLVVPTFLSLKNPVAPAEFKFKGNNKKEHHV